MTMTQIRGEYRHAPFDINAATVPLQQCLNYKSVPKVMKTWAMTVVFASKADLARQYDKPSTYGKIG